MKHKLVRDHHNSNVHYEEEGHVADHVNWVRGPYVYFHTSLFGLVGKGSLG